MSRDQKSVVIELRPRRRSEDDTLVTSAGALKAEWRKLALIELAKCSGYMAGAIAAAVVLIGQWLSLDNVAEALRCNWFETGLMGTVASSSLLVGVCFYSAAYNVGRHCGYALVFIRALRNQRKGKPCE